MALYYSASAHGFFDDAVHPQLPADAQPISAARHRELLTAQAEGAAIEAGADGKPRQRRRTVTLPTRRAAAIAQVKREAARRIADVSPDWRQRNDLRAPTPAGVARFVAIDEIRAASDLIEVQIAAAELAELQQLDIAAHPAWPTE